MPLTKLDRRALMELADPEIHGALTSILQREDVDGVVVFRNQQMDSSAFGHVTFMIYGPHCTYSAPPEPNTFVNDLPSQREYAVAYFPKPTRKDEHNHEANS